MYPQLYPRHLSNVARVVASEGTAMVIYRAGEIKHFLVSDTHKLVAYCQQHHILVGDQRILKQAGVSEPEPAVKETPANQPNSRIKLSEKAQASLDKVIKKFKNGDLSPITHAVRLGLDPAAPARNWTLSNRVLAFAQTDQVDCRGYRQWQAAGRQVKKGSHSAYILRPRTVKKKRLDAKGQEEEYPQLIGFIPIAVFSIADTDGAPLPEYEPQELSPLAEVAQKLGIDITYQPLPADRLGDYSPGKDKIRLSTHDAATFFHELAHAAHKRIDGQLKGGQDSHQETVAEFTAAVLMELYGIRDHSGNAWRYIESYAQDPLIAITKALATVEKVLRLLLTA